jgi:hypothetical protein
MKNFVYREVWLPLEVNGDEEASTLKGAVPLIYKGAEVMFRIALFDRLPVDEDDPGELRDISNLVAFVLKVRSTSYAGTELLDSTAGTVTFDPTVTAAQFHAMEKAPISVYLPKAITAITAGQQYVTFAGMTSEAAQDDGFGRCRVNVVDIGLGGASSAPAAGVEYVTSDMFRAAVQGFVKYGRNPAGKTVTFVSRSGRKGRVVGCDDNGNSINAPESY